MIVEDEVISFLNAIAQRAEHATIDGTIREWINAHMVGRDLSTTEMFSFLTLAIVALTNRCEETLEVAVAVVATLISEKGGTPEIARLAATRLLRAGVEMQREMVDATFNTPSTPVQ